MGIFHKVKITEEAFKGGFYAYKNFQCHINILIKIKQEMYKDLERHNIDKNKVCFLTIAYDDAYNLFDPKLFRCSYGFLLREYDSKILEVLEKQLGFKWTQLPKAKSLYGSYPFKFSSSISLGQMRFYPECWGYIIRNKKKLDIFMNREQKSGTLELIDNGEIQFYMPLENFKDFYLTQHGAPEVRNDGKYTSILYKKNQ